MEGIFECVGFYGIESPQAKPSVNTPYTVRKFIKKNERIGFSQDKKFAFLVNEDCVYLNELKNIDYCGVEVPYLFRNFSELQIPDPLK